MEREFPVGIIKDFLEEVLFELIGILIDEDEENGNMVYWNICPTNNVSLCYFHKEPLISKHHSANHKILMAKFYTYSTSNMSSYTYRMNFYYVPK